jgi:hypothetical protein
MEEAEDEFEIPPPPAAGSPEEHLRATLDARRASIRQCAGNETVVVRASWSMDGSVSVALDAPGADPEMQTCVALAIGQQRVPSGSAGEVVHHVR